MQGDAFDRYLRSRPGLMASCICRTAQQAPTLASRIAPCMCAPQPQLGGSWLLQLGEPKYRVTYLDHPGPQPANGSSGTSDQAASSSGQAGQQWVEAVRAAAAFQRVAAAAAGSPWEGAGGGQGGQQQGEGASMPSQPGTQSQSAEAAQAFPGGYGPWRPYMARVAANTRITAESHFQDTRHIELDLGHSGLTFEPGGCDACDVGVIKRSGAMVRMWLHAVQGSHSGQDLLA